MKCPWSTLHKKFHPKHRIFLSIDAIGSTALKSTLAKHGCTPDVWATCFMAFLPEVEVIYWNKYKEIAKKFCNIEECREKCFCTREGGSDSSEDDEQKLVSVWKYIGDEVVLVAELTCVEYQPVIFVLALAETLKELNNNFNSTPIKIDNSDKSYTLQFKGTAWVAGFPVSNIEILLKKGKEIISDYLGPSIDLGFRLAKYATKDKIVISAPLALFIIQSSVLKSPIKLFGQDLNRLPLCFSSLVEAKGVRDGTYPLIWFPLIETPESVLCIVERDKLEKYLHDEHFKDNKIPPFILKDAFYNEEYYRAYDLAVARQKKVPNSIFYADDSRKTNSKYVKTLDKEDINIFFSDIIKKLTDDTPFDN